MKTEQTTGQPSDNYVQKGKITSTHSSKRNYVFGLIVLLIICLVTIAIYQNHKKSYKTSSIAKPLNYQFDTINKGVPKTTHHLLGYTPLTGMEFSVPSSGLLYTDSPISGSDPRFANRKSFNMNDPGQDVELGQRLADINQTLTYPVLIVAKILPLPQDSSFDSTSYFKNLLIEKSFNTSSNKNAIDFNLRSNSDFTNKNITSGGHIYDINAKVQKGVAAGSISQVQGVLVLIKGKNADYYLMISAVDQDWNSGKKTWQAVLDSIKVDQ